MGKAQPTFVGVWGKAENDTFKHLHSYSFSLASIEWVEFAFVLWLEDLFFFHVFIHSFIDTKIRKNLFNIPLM